MHSAICGACLKSDILCSSCQKKIDDKSISAIEFEVARFLSSLEGKIKSLESAKIIKVVDCTALIIVAAKGDAAKIVGKQGSVVKMLARRFGKPVRIVEAGNISDFINNLIIPASAKVNTAYVNGKECYRIKVLGHTKRKIAINMNTVKLVAEEVFKKPVEMLME